MARNWAKFESVEKQIVGSLCDTSQENLHPDRESVGEIGPIAGPIGGTVFSTFPPDFWLNKQKKVVEGVKEKKNR